jgi:hypothetical protein
MMVDMNRYICALMGGHRNPLAHQMPQSYQNELGHDMVVVVVVHCNYF